MKKHVFLAVLLAGVLGLSALAAGQKQLDIALEGPWILFTKADKMDGHAILVAVAPIDATDTEPIGEEDHFHHYPQLSSGNGFYLPKPSSSTPGIFCLAFDVCAPDAGSDFKYDPNYTSQDIVQLTGNSMNKQWRSYGAKNEVIILPMPDSYHADGAWPFQFHDANHKPGDSYNKDNYIIGLILHYSKVPVSRLKLFSCPSNVASAADCKNEAKDDKGHLIEVTNTGTLRLQMRAPDTTSDCDHHVRYGFHQMLKLLDPKFTEYTKYRYIEPAMEMDSKDNGVFETSTSNHPCFDSDPDDQDDNLSTATLHHAVATQGKEANTTNSFTEGLNTVDAQWPPKDPQFDDKQSYKLARKDFADAKALSGSLRISDVSKMGALAALSAKQIGILIAELQLQSARGNNLSAEIDTVPQFEKLRRALKAFADTTKNGADCRAPQAQVQ